MSRIILRQGPQWKSPSRRVVHRFHSLTRQYGSEAIWLPVNGMLVTHDPEEADKSFPYENWLKMASYEGPEQSGGQPMSTRQMSSEMD